MNRDSDVVCPYCGSDIVWQNDGLDIAGQPGDDYPVGCTNRVCDANSEGWWMPVPRADYTP